MFNFFMINMEKDLDRYQFLKNIYKKKYDIDLIRFNAINGKLINVNNFNQVSLICKLFCPKSVIGIGLSHNKILEEFKNYDNYEYMVILEDDALPIFKNKNELINIVKNMPKDCDILNLRCIGTCFHKNKKYVKTNFTLSGGALACVIKKSSIPNINKTLYHHVDFQRTFNPSINIYSLNNRRLKLFDVYEHKSTSSAEHYDLLGFKNIHFDNTDLHQILSYKMLRIPFFEYEISWYIFFIIIFIIIYQRNK
jgi:GR25 family glycosyltransferase involved in LPS biosynthesis